MLAEKYQERIADIFSRYPDKRSAVMQLLYVAQAEYGWVTPQSLEEIADLCELDPTQVKGVAGFYTMYSEKPKGKFWLQVCTDLPCALRGAEEFHHQLLDTLGIDEGGTTPDGLFTAEHVTCLAACDKAPMLQCNFHFHENLDMKKMNGLLNQWRQEAAQESDPAYTGDAAPVAEVSTPIPLDLTTGESAPSSDRESSGATT